MADDRKIIRVCFYGLMGKAFLTMNDGSIYVFSSHDLTLKKSDGETNVSEAIADYCTTVIQNKFDLGWIKKTLVLETKKHHAYAMAVVALGVGFGDDMRTSCLRELNQLIADHKVRRFLRKKFMPQLIERAVIDKSIGIAHLKKYYLIEDFLNKTYVDVAKMSDVIEQ